MAQRQAADGNVPLRPSQKQAAIGTSPHERGLAMKAIRIHEPTGISGLVFEEAPDATPMVGDVLVKVAACGITHNELDWPLWTCRNGHQRTSIIPGQEVSGVVTALGLGTAGIAVGDEVFGLTDPYRDAAAAEYVAVEARNLAPKPQTADHVDAAAGQADLVFDTIGGEVLARSPALLRPGGALVSVVSLELPADRDDIRKVFFIQEASRAQLIDLARLVDEGHLRPQVGGVYPLAEAAEAYSAKAAGGIPGRIILQP